MTVPFSLLFHIQTSFFRRVYERNILVIVFYSHVRDLPSHSSNSIKGFSSHFVTKKRFQRNTRKSMYVYGIIRHKIMVWRTNVLKLVSLWDLYLKHHHLVIANYFNSLVIRKSFFSFPVEIFLYQILKRKTHVRVRFKFLANGKTFFPFTNGWKLAQKNLEKNTFKALCILIIKKLFLLI